MRRARADSSSSVESFPRKKICSALLSESGHLNDYTLFNTDYSSEGCDTGYLSDSGDVAGSVVEFTNNPSASVSVSCASPVCGVNPDAENQQQQGLLLLEKLKRLSCCQQDEEQSEATVLDASDTPDTEETASTVVGYRM